MIENIIFQDDDTEESVVACTLDADLVQNTNGDDEVIIVVDIRRIHKKVRTKIVLMSCKGDLDFLCNCSVTVAHLRPQTHERFPGTPQNLDNLDTNEFANVLGTIAEDVHFIQCDQTCSQVQKTTKMSGTIKERSTKSWETQTRNEEEMLSHVKLVGQNMTEKHTTEKNSVRLTSRTV